MLGPIIAPILVGACVAATAQPAREPTQIVRDEPELQEAPFVGSKPSHPESFPVPLYAVPAAVPVHEVEDSLVPPTLAPSFTRTIERARIEARGVNVRIDTAALRAAAAANNQIWPPEQRRELLAFLRDSVLDRDRDAEFTEEDARIIAQLQAGSGATPDGRLDDETTAILFAVGFHFSSRMAGAVKLEFYPAELEDLEAWNREIEEKVTQGGGGFQDVYGPPGEGTIYVRVGTSIVAGYRARGGPPSPLEDGKHMALPTTPGTYRLGEAHRHVSGNWHYSQIPWGAEIREMDGGYQYRWSTRSPWLWATVHPTGKLKDPLETYEFGDLPEVTRNGVTYYLWTKNDFGPIAWNLVPSDQYVHTTPHNEAEMADGGRSPLGFSHGCIHIDPRERDEMMKRGYLRKDVPFVVRRWTEHQLPEEIRREMLAPVLVSN